MRKAMLPLPEISSWIGESELHKAQVERREGFYPDMATVVLSSRYFIISNPREIYDMIGVRAISFLVPVFRSH